VPRRTVFPVLTQTKVLVSFSNMYRSHAHSSFAVFALPLIFSLLGCAGAPVQEMSNARQTINAARAAGAEDHAPTQLAEASDLLGKAERALQQHEYRLARRQAEEARRQAQEALQLAASVDKS
jgi:hypothetical protein